MKSSPAYVDFPVADWAYFTKPDNFWSSPIESLYTPPNKKVSERDIFFHMADKVFTNLGVIVTLEPGYKTLNDQYTNKFIRTKALGIGTRDTWHGIPDACIGSGVNVVYLPEDEDEAQKERKGDGEGEHKTAKIRKKVLAPKHLSQFVATTVVSSFTRYHFNRRSVVPTVAVDKTSIRGLIYDCSSDLLLVSETLPLNQETWKNKKYNLKTILFLYTLFHHV